MSSYESLTKLLRSQGYSLTNTRRLVYSLLANNEPLTMIELVRRCLPTIDRASVYRTVALYEQLGIAQRLYIGWKYKLELSNAFQAHHHHLSCTVCGNVIVLAEDIGLEQRLTALAQPHGYTMLDHQLEIKGVCLRCQNIEP